MAEMIVQYRVMPKDGDVEYSFLEKVTKEIVEKYAKSIKILEINPQDVGFGLKACIIKFQLDENEGSEKLENQLMESKEVGEVHVELMDRL